MSETGKTGKIMRLYRRAKRMRYISVIGRVKCKVTDIEWWNGITRKPFINFANTQCCVLSRKEHKQWIKEKSTN
jgi:hypothetical protein